MSVPGDSADGFQAADPDQSSDDRPGGHREQLRIISEYRMNAKGEIIMSPAIRRSIAAIAIVVLITLAGLLSATTASAQCTTYTVINDTRCELNLILYDGNGNTAGFHIYPTGATITLPSGFDMPAGFISNAGTRMPFDLGSWCTPCASISGWFELPSCCAMACTIDKPSGNGCIITLKPCAFRCAP